MQAPSTTVKGIKLPPRKEQLTYFESANLLCLPLTPTLSRDASLYHHVRANTTDTASALTRVIDAALGEEPQATLVVDKFETLVLVLGHSETLRFIKKIR